MIECLVQGNTERCSVSAILFPSVDERLKMIIKSHSSIKGFRKGGMTNHIHVIQHAGHYSYSER